MKPVKPAKISPSGSHSNVQSTGSPEATFWGVGLRGKFAGSASSPRQRERERATRSSPHRGQGAPAGPGPEPARPSPVTHQAGDAAGLGRGAPEGWGESGWVNSVSVLSSHCCSPFPALWTFLSYSNLVSEQSMIPNEEFHPHSAINLPIAEQKYAAEDWYFIFPYRFLLYSFCCCDTWRQIHKTKDFATFGSKITFSILHKRKCTTFDYLFISSWITQRCP